MEYKISTLEKKTTSTGKVKIDAELIDVSGTTIEGVTIWDSFPNFNSITFGTLVSGDIVTKQNGKYTNKTLYPPRNNTPQGGAFRGSQGIAKAQEIKREDIKEAQTRKEEAITKAGAQRDSVLIVTTLYKSTGDITEEDVKKKIEYWYKYFINLGDQPFV